MDPITPYLDFVTESRGQPPHGHRYSCFEHFVREWGIPFKPHWPLPEDVQQGELGDCFNNCFRVVPGTDLIYCEGFATGIFPVLHAWCITPEGVVVDPTWRPHQAFAYYGIPFNFKYIFKKAQKTSYVSVIDDFKQRWPLMKGLDPQEWLHPSYETLKQVLCGSQQGAH